MISYPSLKLDMYQNNDSYLGIINVPKNDIKENYSFKNPPKLVIILDTSGSMDQNLDRLMQTIIPNFIKNIYDRYPKYRITLITFSDKGDAKVYKGDANYLSKIKEIKAGGCTFMHDAVEVLYKLIFTKQINKNLIRLLTISDGELHDQEETMESADKLKKLIQERNIVVNSNAIRLFTSSEQPDTRGLSSMLQLSTIIGNQMLLDIDCRQPDQDICKLITDLYINDNFDNCVLLKTKNNEKCFQREPWLPLTDSIYLFQGTNTFWIKNISLTQGNNDINICSEVEQKFNGFQNGKKLDLKCNLCESLSEKNYLNLIKEKLDFYLKQLRVLKIVNTAESLDEIDKIISFVNDLEENVFKTNQISSNKNQNKLYERAQYLKSLIKRRQDSIINKMREIRNDDKVNQLNSKQQAEYLREIDINNKTARGLAKRAIEGGIDFDEIVRKEVEQIANNIHELDDIDDSSFTESFYSACNTLDGIKAICEFYQEAKKENIFEQTTANDILKIINLVGIAGYADIGDFPDPMTYRIQQLYPGTFISLSDILIAYEIKKENSLKEIGGNNEINICIPYFENEKIEKYLIKYAPKLLEYNASVNMRRVLADIPYTNEYTILAGIFALVPMILKDKKEIYIKIFVQLTKNYLIASGNHFLYVLDLLKQQKEMDKDGLSLYIANNGITNMTSPLLLFLKNNEGKDADNMVKRIVRATMQFEIYQYIRKNIRMQKTDNPEKYIENTLIDLLCIDLEESKKKVPELFEEAPDIESIKFSGKYSINETKYEEIMSNIYWVDQIAIIPLFLKITLSEDFVSEFKKIEIDNITEEIMRERLGINFDTKLFKLYSIVQSFLQYEKSSRVDTELKKMKILDLGIQENAEKYLKDYIKSLHKKQYEKALKEKVLNEKKTLAKELIKKLVEEKDIKIFISLLQKGINKGSINYKFNDQNNLTFFKMIELFTKITNDVNSAELRNRKIFILLSGKDVNKEHTIIWNKGNGIKDLNKYYFLKDVLSQKLWADLSRTCGESHVYREMENRKGHSNKHPSYWALGYKSIQEMKAAVSEEEFKKYVLAHQNCCGFYKGVYVIMRNRYKKENLNEKELDFYNKNYKHLFKKK